LFGAVTGTSIVRLLLAGIVPAIITVILLMILTGYIGIRRKYPRQEKFSTRREILDGLGPALPALMAPVFLIVGMLFGFFTPTEAASIVVAYVIFIGIVVYKDLTVDHIKTAAIMTIKQTGSICVIIAVATLFGWVMTIEKVPLLFTKIMQPFMENTILFLLVINALLLIVGMFLDSNTATLIVIPIIMPTLLKTGLDPVQIGIIVVFNLMIGLLTPPMGLSLLLISEMVQVSVGKVFREVLIFMIPLMAALLIITYVPVVSLLIPSLLMN
jgi:tripartite ATP-independent transporter DctM subunit